MLKFKTFNYLLVSLKLICSLICGVWAFKTVSRSSIYFKIMGACVASCIVFMVRYPDLTIAPARFFALQRWEVQHSRLLDDVRILNDR